MIRVFFSLFAVMCLTATARAQLPQEALDAYMSSYAQIERFRGVAAVRLEDEVWAKGYGLADEASQTPNTPDHQYLLASVTKIFTATLVLSLVEDGRLALDQPVSSYLDTLSDALPDHVTVRSLLTHTSGLKREVHEDGRLYQDAHSNAALLEAIAYKAVQFEAGDHNYSNTGYVLLRILCEHVTGEPYEALLESRIFQPAGMTQSGVWDLETNPTGLANGYARVGEATYLSNPTEMSSNLGAGGVYSSITDLLRLDTALTDRRLLADTSQADRRLGWQSFSPEPSGPVFHSGDTAGVTALFLRSEDQGVSIILLGNQGGAPRSRLFQGIADVLAERPPQAPTPDYANLVFAALLDDGEAAARTQMRAAIDALGRPPLHAMHMIMAGNTLSGAGKTHEAGDVFRLATLFFRDDALAWVAHGRWNQNYGDPAIARQAYQTALEIHPDDPRALRFLQELEDAAP